MAADDLEDATDEAAGRPVRQRDRPSAAANPRQLVGSLVLIWREHHAERRDHRIELAVGIGQRFSVGDLEVDGQPLGRSAPFAAALSGDIAQHGNFNSVASGLRLMINIKSATGPLAPVASLPLEDLVQTSYRRLIYLVDDLPQTPEEEIPDRLSALKLMNEVLRGEVQEALDGDLFDAAIVRIMTPETPPEIVGAALAFGYVSGRVEASTLTDALQGQFQGAAPDTEQRIAMLRGILHTEPALVWRVDGLLAAINGFLDTMEQDRFLTLLPHLRLAFTSLNPRETDRLSGMVAAHLGIEGSALTPATHTISEAELQRGVEIEARLNRVIAEDGLDDWLASAGDAPS